MAFSKILTRRRAEDPNPDIDLLQPDLMVRKPLLTPNPVPVGHQHPISNHRTFQHDGGNAALNDHKNPKDR